LIPQAIAGFCPDNPIFTFAAFFDDRRGGHPKLTNLDAIIALIFGRMFKVKELRRTADVILVR